MGSQRPREEFQGKGMEVKKEVVRNHVRAILVRLMKPNAAGEGESGRYENKDGAHHSCKKPGCEGEERVVVVRV